MFKVGLIGCGGMGNHHATILKGMKNVDLVGVCDLHEDRAEACGKKNGVKWCLDFHDLLPDIDVAWVCTQPYKRVNVVVDCAKAGKQIFTEKPICNTLKGADTMLAAVKKAKVQYMLGYCLRFTNPFKLMRDTLASGELGDLVNCWTRRYMPVDMSNHWYGVQSKSGGVALDFGSHDIDWLRWLGGDVKSVFAKTFKIRKTMRADEHAQAMMVFKKSGMASTDVSWASYIGAESIGVVGTKGGMVIGRDGKVHKAIGNGPPQILDVEAAMAVDPKGNVGKRAKSGKIEKVASRLETIQEHFFRCLEEGIEPTTPATDGRQTLLTFLAMKESARRGTSVKLAEIKQDRRFAMAARIRERADMIKLGMIGMGNMGTGHARIIARMPNVEIVRVCDLIEEKARNVGEEVGAPWCTDYADLLDEVEAVWICTEPFNRRDVVVACARAGKHIFTEKPICVRLDEADEMLAATSEAGVKYALGYCCRHEQPYRMMRDAFKSGELGELVSTWSRRLGCADMSSLWYGWQEQSGGVMLDLGSHDVDWFIWLNGEFKTVFGRSVQVRSHMHAKEHAQALMFYRNGGMATTEISWASQVGENSWGIIGTKGALISGRDNNVVKRLVGGEEETILIEANLSLAIDGGLSKADDAGKVPGAQGIESIQEHFFRCIGEDLVPETTATEGRKALLTCMAIEESSRRGSAVDLEELT